MNDPNQRRRARRWLVVQALAGAAALGFSYSDAAQAQEILFDNPAKQFHTMGKLKAPAERTVYLPVVQVKWLLHGKGSGKGGIGPGTTIIQEVNSTIDAARIADIARALHDDLVAQLEAAGWNVQTRAELGVDVPGYKPASPDKDLGVPVVKERGEDEYVLITPPDMPAVSNTGMALAGVSMATNGYMRKKPGVNLFVTYGFSTATIRETARRQIEMETKPVLTLFGTFAANTSATTAIVTSDSVVAATDIGTLSKASQTSSALSALQFLSRQRMVNKTEFTLEPDWNKVASEAVPAGRQFNAQIVARLNAGK